MAKPLFILILSLILFCTGASFSEIWYPSKDSTIEAKVSLVGTSQALVLPRNKVFSLNILFRSARKKIKIKSLSFDARMPVHRHGMVTLPKATMLSEDSFLIEGVKLHMMGTWEFTIKVDTNLGQKIFVIPYELD